MKLALPVTVAIAILTAPAPASALDTTAGISFGYTTFDKAFDKDGNREDRDGSRSELPIVLSAYAQFFRGLGAGLDFSFARITDEQGGANRKSFGLRELTVKVGYDMPIGPQGNLDLRVGFKLDLAKEELKGADEVFTSDLQQAFIAGLGYTHRFGALGVHAGVGLVVHLEGEFVAAGATTRFQSGILVAPTLGVRYAIQKLMLGLDIGAAIEGEDDLEGKAQKDTDSYVVFIHPWAAFEFWPGHFVKLGLGLETEDFTMGIPVAGKNFIAPAIPPVTVGYRGQF